MANNVAGATIYPNDTKAYYGEPPVIAQADELIVSPKIYKEANNRYLNKEIYQLDQKPYYAAKDFKVLSNDPKMKVVPIELNDLKNTFADPKNIKHLEGELQRITEKESLNSVILSGKYFKDPAPYYDPAAEERAVKVEHLTKTISEMKSELAKDQKGPVFTEENFKKNTKIQNYSNSNKEATNKFIKDSYYYEPKAFTSKN